MPKGRLTKHSFCKMARGRNFNLVKSYADRMRVNPTLAEAAFYRHIGKLRPLTGHISRQHHVIGRRNAFILDAYLTEKKIGFEIDGGYHETPEQKKKDRFKDNYCRSNGITIVRLTNKQALNEWVSQLIILEAIGAPEDIIALHKSQSKEVKTKLRKNIYEAQDHIY